MDAAIAADPGRGHAVLMSADMLGVIRVTDLMIADVSSVSLDHLYLRPDAPLALCDRRTDRARLLEDAPVASGALVVDATSIGTLDGRPRRAAAPTTRCGRSGTSCATSTSTRSPPARARPGSGTSCTSAIHHHDAALRELSRVRVIEENA